MTSVRIVVALMVSAVLGGCAFGNTIGYKTQLQDLNIKSQQDVVVGVQDLRPYVVSGENTKQFVGLQRAGFGNPFGVHTKSGDPLADDIADTIVNTLKMGGVKAQAVAIPSSLDSGKALAALLKIDAGRYLFVYFEEWKSDTYTNVALLYDVTAKVYDKSGNLLAQNDISGREDLGGSFMNPVGHAEEAVPVAFRKNLTKLLGHPSIVKALE